jgi:dTDP-4-dehydrorhamnose 3,5-epimerase
MPVTTVGPPVSQCSFRKTPLAGLQVLQRSRIEDARGFLSRIYAADVFASAGMSEQVVQINHTLTRAAGTVRGMHFQQPPHAEIKIVNCLRGEVFDVAVDLRRGSLTFLKWHGEILSAENQRSLLIPEGFAHGFQSLANDSELFYLHTALYHSSAEGGVSPTDPRLAITWPLTITEMSDRDRAHPLLTTDFHGLSL